MPRWYNVTAVGNTTGVVDFLQKTNTYLLDGWFGSLILATFFLILISSFMHKTNGSFKKSLLGASTITAIVAIGFKIMYLIPNFTMFVFVAIFAISFGFAIFSSEG